MNANVYSESCIASIRKHLDKSEHKYITYPKFIFLCGKGFNSTEEYKHSNRGIVEDFIKKLIPDTHIVLSEQMWEDGFDDSIDLLIFEEFLAEVSDAIVLFVESPGSFCELGAFAYADALFSDKLIIVRSGLNSSTSHLCALITKKRTETHACVFVRLYIFILLAHISHFFLIQLKQVYLLHNWYQ